MSELVDQLKADALEAQKFARKHLVVELDFTPQSLSELDDQFDLVEYAIPGGKSPANIDLLAKIWGAYLGEYLRRELGGEWFAQDGEDGPRIGLRLAHETVFPHEQVRRRLTGGPEHNLCDYFEQRKANQ
jgi:hypothetical protein